MKKLSPSGKKRESALKKCATWSPSGCQPRTSRRSSSKRMSRRGIACVVDYMVTLLCVTLIDGTFISATSIGVAQLLLRVV